jgi:hypothetical protein
MKTHRIDAQKRDTGRDHQKKIFHQPNEILVYSSVLNIIHQLSHFFSEGYTHESDLVLTGYICCASGFVLSQSPIEGKMVLEINGPPWQGFSLVARFFP